MFSNSSNPNPIDMEGKEKMKKVITLIIACFLLSGCTSYIIQPSDIKKQHVIEKNYELGKELTAFVGDPIIKVKDYYITPTELYLNASSDFIVAARFGADIGGGIGKPLTGSKLSASGQLIKYPLLGYVIYNGVKYRVVELPKYKMRFLIDGSGRVSNKMLQSLPDGTNIIAFGKFNISPKDLTFTPANEKESGGKVDIAGGYLNYELIYTGSDGKTLSILYREFTPDDIARPSFYQNLTFSAKQNRIRFKKYLIEVKEATNEKITFKVIKDTK